jgi:hypothetical protein
VTFSGGISADRREIDVVLARLRGRQRFECSALANRLGDPALALAQAELSKHALEGWIANVPDSSRHEDMLSAAWERLAKAHWSLGERNQALAAFREFAAVRKRLFEREPSDQYRLWLTKCYNELVFYGSRGGDLRGAADAILERTRLWPGNAKQVAQAAEDFETLAERVTARSRGHLTREDQTERDHYLAESRRVRRAAEAASRRAEHDLRVER